MIDTGLTDFIPDGRSKFFHRLENHKALMM